MFFFIFSHNKKTVNQHGQGAVSLVLLTHAALSVTEVKPTLGSAFRSLDENTSAGKWETQQKAPGLVLFSFQKSSNCTQAWQGSPKAYLSLVNHFGSYLNSWALATV